MDNFTRSALHAYEIKRLLFAVLSCFLLTQDTDCQDLIIENVNLVDVELGVLYPNQSLSVKDGLILEIQENSTRDFKTKIDGSGLYLMPGLIDAHIHLFQSGGLYARPDMLDLRHVRPYSEEVALYKSNAEDLLQRYLSAGITTVIDAGGPMHNFDLRDS